MSLSAVPTTGLKHAVAEPGDLAEKRATSKSGRTAPSDSECSCETASLSCDSADRPRARQPPPTAQGKNRSRRRGSEWEVLEGLKDGQRFEKRPEVYTGYLHKKRKWPLKGWHKRYFVIDGGILVYARSAGDVSRGRLHGSVDVGLSVISAKSRRRRVDIDADEFIYHLRAKTNDIFRHWLHVLKAHRLYRQHLLTFGTRESAAKIHVPLTELPATENSSNATLSSYSSSLSILTSEDSSTFKKKTPTHTTTSFDQFMKPHLEGNDQNDVNPKIESKKTNDDDIIPLLNSTSLSTLEGKTSLKSKPPETTSFKQFMQPNNVNEASYHQMEQIDSIKSIMRWRKTDLSPLNIKALAPNEQRLAELKYNELIRLKRKALRLRQGEDVSVTNTSIGSRSVCNSSKNYQGSNANTDDDWLQSTSLTAVLSSLVNNETPPSINVSLKKTKPSRKKIILKTNSGLSTFFLFAKQRSNKPIITTDTIMKKSKKCTDVTKYQNSRAESPLPKPYSKCMILGNHKLYKNKFKIHQETQMEGEIKNDKSQQKSMTVEEFDSLTDKLVVALFENKVGNMDGLDEDDIKIHITKLVKKLNDVTATIESNPVKVMFKTLLEYWLKNTSIERMKGIIKNAKSIGKQSPNLSSKDETFSVKLKGSNKSTQVSVLKARRRILKYNSNEDKKEKQIQQLEQLLKNTVYFCETMRGTFKDKDIDITKKLINNLDNISNIKSSVKKTDSNSSTNLIELQDTFNNLLSESILPPTIAKEFLCAYLDLLAQKTCKSSGNSSQQTFGSNKTKSSSSNSSKELHTNIENEVVKKYVSKSVTTLDRLSTDEIKIINTKDIGIESNLIDPGQLYLKDLLDKLTSMISIFGECQSKYHPVNLEAPTDKETNKGECSVTVNDKPQSELIKHEEPRSEPIKRSRKRNPPILNLSQYDLEDISMKTDKSNDRAMSITLKLKEKANASNNSNLKLRRAQFWAPKPNPIFLRSHGDKNKRRPQKHNRLLSVTDDSKYKSFMNNNESDDSHEFSISSSNFYRNTDFIKGSDDPQSCYIMSSFKKTQPATNKLQMNKLKKVRLKECNGLVIGQKIDNSVSPLTPRNRDFTMFQSATPKVIDEKFILTMFENLVQLATNVPALHKDINGLYIKLKKKYEKGSRNASSSQGLSLLGKIYQEDTNKSNIIDNSTQYDTDTIEKKDTKVNKSSYNVIMKEFAANTCIATTNVFTQVQVEDNIDQIIKTNLTPNLNKTLSSRPILIFQPSGIGLKQNLNLTNGTNKDETMTNKLSKRLSIKDMALLRNRINTNVIKETSVVSPQLISFSDLKLSNNINQEDKLFTKTSRHSLKNYETVLEKISNEAIIKTSFLSTQSQNYPDSKTKNVPNQEDNAVHNLKRLAIDDITLEEKNNERIIHQAKVLSLQLLTVCKSKTANGLDQENKVDTKIRRKVLKDDISFLERGMNKIEKPRVLSPQLLRICDSITTDDSKQGNDVVSQIRRKSLKDDMMLLEKRLKEKMLKQPRVLSPDWKTFSDSATTSNSNEYTLFNKIGSQPLEDDVMSKKKDENRSLSPALRRNSDAQTDNQFVILPMKLSSTFPIVSNTISLNSAEFLGVTLCDVPPFRCKSVPSVSSGTTGPLAGFVTGTPGGKLASWIVETGAPLESASRELGQAQLSIQQLQRVYDALEMHNQIHHDTDASVDGTTSLVKKDRRKFGLRKKKASVKGSSVDLNSQHHNLDVHSGHSGLSALTAPPSPGGGASSLPSSAASLPIACAAARPQSWVEVNSGPGSLTSDHHLREDFLLHAREVLQTLNSVLTTLVNERTRMSSLVANEGGDAVMVALRNNLNTAILQNNELRSRLSRIHDASDIAEISSMGANSEQCNRALSYSSSCVSASEFYDAEEHRIPAEEIQSGVIELDGDSSSEVGSLSSEDEAGSHGDSSDNSDPALEAVVGVGDVHDRDERPERLERRSVPRRRSLPSVRPAGGPSLWNLLYKNIGKDLSQISMPVTINEPLNMLQRLCEELEYCSLLDRAAACTDPLTRAALVATFAVSAYGSAGHRAASKPFNPLLGETYECVREDRGFKFIAEQVSHHPPISACHAESASWTFWQEARIKTKFWGKSMEFQPAGQVHIKLHTTGDHYSWNKVTTCVHNLFGGQRWVDQYGDMHVVCHTADISAKLSFIKASSWSSSRHEVRGVVQGCGRRVRISGSWSGGLQIGDPPHHETAWRPDPMPPKYEIYYGFTKFAMELNELEPGMKEILPHTDTRLRPDQRALEEGDVEAAEKYKSELEQAQRDRRNDTPHHTPMWFRKTITDSGEEMWVFNEEYWTSRAAGFPSLSAPTLW